MYLQNKYTNCYYSIINRAKSRVILPNEAIEKHHIIPKSLGGSNNSTNLVNLTPREHFICHLLLPKMTEGLSRRKMSFALRMMTSSNKNHKRTYKITSKIYETIKKTSSEAHKERWNDSNLKQEASDRLTEKWKDPAWRENITSKITDSWLDPEKRRKQSIIQTKKWEDPEMRKKQSEVQKHISKINPELGKKKSRPGELNGMYGKTHTYEVKAKLAQLRKDELTGKSYEELYGKEKANSLKQDKSVKLKSYCQMNPGVREGANNGNAKECVVTTPLGILSKLLL